MTVRVRYAPSPTGAPHVGNIRTALFAWLLARHAGGQMLVRIEDTDRARMVPGSYEAILDSLRWLGLDWDEGPDIGGPFAPYVQSERLPLYQAAIERLIAQGDAYRCFCTSERLDALRAAQQKAGRPTGYDRHCRNLDPEDARARAAAGEPYVVRFAMPTTGTTVLHDAIRGAVTFDNAKLDDHVLLKSDGFPTYHLAATLDDELMQITHVIRGEEWISSAPRHLLFHAAMGAAPPIYAHPPLILGPDRKKLSKRNGDAAVSDYRDTGYLPDTLFNFLGTLGWSLDDKTTLISRDQFIERFSLDRVGSSPAMWDMKKLEWMNAEYIRMVPDDVFLRRLMDELERDLPPQVPRPVDREIVAAALPELKTRLRRMTDAVSYVEYLFPQFPITYQREHLLGRAFKDDPSRAAEVLRFTAERLATLESWDEPTLDAATRAIAAELGLKLGDYITPVRIGITGRTVHLPTSVVMVILGKELTLRRLADAGMALV